MAKKKVAPQTSEYAKSTESIYAKFDMQLLTHKYSDYYTSTKQSDENLAQMGLAREGDESEEQGDFVWYDTREVFYPVYKAIIDYQITKIQPIHPIIIAILKSVKYLETLKNVNITQKLKAITQLDDEIYGSISSELITKGLLSNENGEMRLSDKGKDALREEKEKIVDDESAVVAIDGIYNEVLEVAKSVRDMRLPHKPSKDSIELKPKARPPRSENLYEEFSDNKTLYQVLAQALQGLDSVDKDSVDEAGQSERQSVEVSNILAVCDVRKFYKKYICLFYKNANDEEKILVVSEKYEIDAEITKLFDRLISEQNLTPSNANSNAWKDKEDKRERLSKEVIESKLESALDLSEGAMLEVGEHKRYFIYVLKNAKKHIYIQSPWVRHNVLEIYKEYIQSALEKGIKITIKYGMQKRSEKDKQEIDEEALTYLNELKAKYPNFSLKHDYDHSKILICDDEFMIVGSFNWLSFGGENKGGEALRGETSTIIKNKDSIKKQIAKFD